MATELITGLGDEPHVDAGDVGGFQAGIVGVEDYMLPAGEQMKATVISNNKIRIAEGEAVMQGRHWRIKPNTYEDVTIENGAQNMNRKDAIIARYTKNADTGIEKVELAVLKGTPTSGTAIAPAQEKGNILEGTMKHEMLLYIVSLKGLNIESVTAEFNVLMNMSMINKSLSDNVSELGENYIKFANGFLLQWGTTTHGKYITVTSDVNLPIAYRDAGYRVSLTPGRNGNMIEKFWVGDSGGNNTNRTKNHFNVSSLADKTPSYERDIEWISIGRWK